MFFAQFAVFCNSLMPNFAICEQFAFFFAISVFFYLRFARKLRLSANCVDSQINFSNIARICVLRRKIIWEKCKKSQIALNFKLLKLKNRDLGVTKKSLITFPKFFFYIEAKDTKGLKPFCAHSRYRNLLGVRSSPFTEFNPAKIVNGSALVFRKFVRWYPILGTSATGGHLFWMSVRVGLAKISILNVGSVKIHTA